MATVSIYNGKFLFKVDSSKESKRRSMKLILPLVMRICTVGGAFGPKAEL